MTDPLDEFFEIDATEGADVVTCPPCGADVPCSLLLLTMKANVSIVERSSKNRNQHGLFLKTGVVEHALVE